MKLLVSVLVQIKFRQSAAFMILEVSCIRTCKMSANFPQNNETIILYGNDIFLHIQQSEKWIEKTSPINPSFVIMHLRSVKGKTDSVEWAGIINININFAV